MLLSLISSGESDNGSKNFLTIRNIPKREREKQSERLITDKEESIRAVVSQRRPLLREVRRSEFVSETVISVETGSFYWSPLSLSLLLSSLSS